MKSLLTARHLTLVFTQGSPSAPSWRGWVEDLPTEAAWEVVGKLQRLTNTSVQRPTGDPHRTLLGAFVDLESELEAWLRKPIEVLEYMLASYATASQTAVLGELWHWNECHRRVWASHHDSPAPGNAPPGIRALPLVADSLRHLVDDRLAPASPGLFELLENDPPNAQRLIRRTRHLAELLQTPLRDLLGNAYEAFCRLEGQTKASISASEPWRRDALFHLDQLRAALPPELARMTRGWLDNFQGTITSHQPPMPTQRPDPYRSPSSPVDWEHGHFLNNWD